MTGSSKNPVIIVGAPRSGTNALRDAMSSLAGFTTWPCDELNPLWRTGNRDVPTDELTVMHARPEVRGRIQNAFAKRARSAPGATVVEKTCANTLRLDFVDRVLPHASYVEIVRDGRDAASSAAERWGASFDLAYSLKKARFVPLADLPGVVVTQLRHRLSKLTGPPQATVRSWGPRFAGLEELIASGASLEQVCAAQWSACTAASDGFFSSHPETAHLRIRYEDFTADPAATLQAIGTFINVPVTHDEAATAGAGVHNRSLGRWEQTALARDHRALDILAPMLSTLGYAASAR